MSKVLVLAPRFPAINQPWIDTYLEQLLINDFEVAIFSANRDGGPCHAKVDRLGLREKVVDFSLDRKAMLKHVLAAAFFSPIPFLASLKLAGSLSADFAKSGSSRLLTALKVLYFRLCRERFRGVSVIHGHEEIAAYEFLHLARVMNIPMVVTFHGLPPAGVGQLSAAKRALLYDYASEVLVNTAFSKKQVVGLGCSPAKVNILPQGLPLEDYPFIARGKPGPHSPVRLLTVGRFHRDKGQGYALVALARLLGAGIAAHWSFVGVGPDKRRLEKLARQLGLLENIMFREGLEPAELLALYHQSDLFVLPSIDNHHGRHVETQGVVLQEAQASGCIPIASRVGGIPECLNDRRDALLVKQKSSRAIADAVRYLLEQVEDWSHFRAAGRGNVEERFSARVVGEKMKEILDGAIVRGVQPASGQEAGQGTIDGLGGEFDVDRPVGND